MNVSCYEMTRDMIIPVVSAIIGGGLTLLGVIFTIQHENKKTLNAYRESIRPFFVIEEIKRTKVNFEEVYISYYDDDSTKDCGDNSIIFHWDDCLLTNVSENVCYINYIKMDGVEYKACETIPIKPGDSLALKGFPMSCYIREQDITSIMIGALDRQQNQYEYSVRFEFSDELSDLNKIKNHVNKTMLFRSIDCCNYILNGKPKQKVLRRRRN